MKCVMLVKETLPRPNIIHTCILVLEKHAVFVLVFSLLETNMFDCVLNSCLVEIILLQNR